MAGSPHPPQQEMITGINVTPLVDVVLVLLVILMVTAGYIVARTIPVDLPQAQTGESSTRTLAITIDDRGRTYIDAQLVDEAQLRDRVRSTRQAHPKARALIAADGAVAHRRVVHIIDLLRRDGITRFAINVQPEQLEH